eukprot:scaffold2404_cov398-Prasinococcus_capsulatus_cf.AAC.37
MRSAPQYHVAPKLKPPLTRCCLSKLLYMLLVVVRLSLPTGQPVVEQRSARARRVALRRCGQHGRLQQSCDCTHYMGKCKGCEHCQGPREAACSSPAQAVGQIRSDWSGTTINCSHPTHRLLAEAVLPEPLSAVSLGERRVLTKRCFRLRRWIERYGCAVRSRLRWEPGDAPRPQLWRASFRRAGGGARREGRGRVETTDTPALAAARRPRQASTLPIRPSVHPSCHPSCHPSSRPPFRSQAGTRAGQARAMCDIPGAAVPSHTSCSRHARPRASRE